MEDQIALDALYPKLRQIGELWDRLLHVRWHRGGFDQLAQGVEDALQASQGIPDRDDLVQLLTQLERLISECQIAGQLPSEMTRERLGGLLRNLRQLGGPYTGMAVEVKTGRSRHRVSAGEILLVAADHSSELVLALENAGFRVRHLSSLPEIRTLLAETTPLAALVDMDCHEGALLASFNMVASDSSRVDLKAPIFFISERGDLTARLEAVSAGAEGYFTKPVDLPLLLDTLSSRLRREAVLGRVLIVNDNQKESREINLILEARGVITQILDQPMEVIQHLYRFQPDLLLLDMDLREVNSLELVKAARQHTDFDKLSIIVCSAQSDLNRRLAALEMGADDLLGKPVAADSMFRAVTIHLRRSQVLQQKLNHLQQRDTVSGLYNRRYFLAQLQRVLAQERGESRFIAVMLITLDNLRSVAAIDLTGSDSVVEQAAQRLLGVLAGGQLAARFGDAIFAILSSGSDRETLLDSARKIRSALEGSPYRIKDDAVGLRCSIGISIADQEQKDMHRLIQQADLACSSAWVAGGDHIQLYHPQINPPVQESQQKSLLELIREAVQQQRMSLVFQPIVSMQGDPSERYEVLLRMHLEGRELLPETVFAVTHRHRLGMVLDRWVIGQSIRLLKERKARVQSTALFINISPAILRDEEFPAWLKTGIEKTSVNPASLVFEASQATSQQHLQGLQEFLDKIRPLGCGFSIDRFSGTEKSLELLDSLAVDYVKLDALFASDLAEDKQKQQQLKELVQKLAGRGVTAIAGNIEKLPTLFALWSCGVNYVQGFFLQQPHPEMNYDFTSGAF